MILSHLYLALISFEEIDMDLHIDLAIGETLKSVGSSVCLRAACLREGDCLGWVYMLEASKSEILYLLWRRKLLITYTAAGL